MKPIVIGAALVLLTIGAARAETDMPPPPAPDGHVCLWTYMIDHTKTVDPGTIVFHMKNGDAWENKLVAPCRGLAFHGFAYVTRDGSICDNAQSIMVLETHEVCMLGAFTKVPPTAP